MNIHLRRGAFAIMKTGFTWKQIKYSLHRAKDGATDGHPERDAIQI
jgi:hypothetical protein